MKKTIALLLALVLLTGCAAKDKTADAELSLTRAPTENKIPYDMEVKESGEDGISMTPAVGKVERSDQKLIRTIQAEVETRDLDALLAAIDQEVSLLNGYIQNRDVYNGSSYSRHRSRGATLTVRVPADQLDRFMGQIRQTTNVVSCSENVDDVTTAYVDTESRMKALETEHERLLELLEKAENMTDLLEIESRLTQVRYEIESVGSQLRVYDNKINYATVNLSISQVEELTVVEAPTFWQRVRTGFMDSLKNVGRLLQNVAAGIMAGSPYLVLGTVLAGGAYFLWKGLRKRSKKKQSEETPE